MNNFKKQKEYWLKKIIDNRPLLNFSLNKIAITKLPNTSSSKRVVFSEKLLKEVENFAIENNLSKFSVMLGAYFVLLYYITGQEFNNKKTFIEIISDINDELAVIKANKDNRYQELLQELEINEQLRFSSLMNSVFFEYYKKLLYDLQKNRNKRIAKIDIIPAKERDVLINKHNNTYESYPENKTIQELFKEQVKKTPNKTAVIFEKRKLSYSELDTESDILAHRITKEGVKSGDLVSVLVERDISLVICVLAVLKAGAVSMLLNVDHPNKRIKSTIKNSGSKTILTTKNIAYLSKSIKVINTNEKINTIGVGKKQLKIKNKTSDSAFAVSTSGSTGKSKYVILSNGAIVNNLFYRAKIANINSESITCLSVLVEFVGMPHHILLPLLFGAKLVIYPQKTIENPYLLFKSIDEDGVSAVEVGVNTLLRFIDIIKEGKEEIQLRGLKFLWFSGAKMDNSALTFFMNKYKTLKCIIVYGCSEYSMVLNNKISTPLETIVEGRPAFNTQLYILNKDKNLLPCYVPGELYVSGKGISKGYLDDPNKNKEVFLRHPFIKGEKMYKTGDFAKRYEDGSIEILGRIDHQINIRGYRLEPEEIEVIIKKSGNVKKVLVISGECPGNSDKYLIAYYTTENQKKLNLKNIKQKLKEELPEYMIPKYFVYLKQFPLNHNNKLDRLALPKPRDDDADKNEYVAPKSEVEKKLAQIWQKLLNIKKVGTNDNFFDLGGYSLLVIKLYTEINNVFKGGLTVQELFENHQFSDMVEIIKKKNFTTKKEGRINKIKF